MVMAIAIDNNDKQTPMAALRLRFDPDTRYVARYESIDFVDNYDQPIDPSREVSQAVRQSCIARGGNRNPKTIYLYKILILPFKRTNESLSIPKRYRLFRQTMLIDDQNIY